MLVSEAHQRLMPSGQPDLVPMPVGQIIGRMNEVRPVAEAQAAAIQDCYLAGDRKGAIAAVPTRMVEGVALIGPWAKIADEIQLWRQTVLTTFSVNTDLRHLDAVIDLIRA
jgi:Luciferase-like monooxygenase